jgi:hypothetical protein
MKKIKLPFFLLIIVAASLVACHKSKDSTTSQPAPGDSFSGGRRMDNFTFLKRCMNGEFSSEEQSKNDTDYFDIRLRMVPIWNSDDKIFYLYVEQAVATSLEKPYRQRVYKVEKINELAFVSHIYMVNRPERLTGKKGSDTIFKELTPDSLKIKDGCEVYLTYNPKEQIFKGATKLNTCPSDRSGASWATSEVTMCETQMVSWDQGWDATGKQVWGATKGGYIFKKKE